MARPNVATRSPSTSSSALSVIHVAAARDADHSSDHSRQSTPLSMITSRSSTPVEVSTHEGKTTERHTETSRKRERPTGEDESTKGSRNVSGLTGVTLFDEEEREEAVKEKKRRKLQAVEPPFPEELPPRAKRRPSVRDAVKQAANIARSALGKRTREVSSVKLLKELDTGSRGLLQDIDLDEEDDLPEKPAKRAKRGSRSTKSEPQSRPPTSKSLSGRSCARKLWLSNGLYAGQDSSADSSKNERKKLQKHRPATTTSDQSSDGKMHTLMPMPMFGFLDHQRDFTIPFDVFAPTFKKGDEKPKDWHQLNRNRLVGEAKELWEKDPPLARSLCNCARPPAGSRGCDDNCLNRAMHYECDENNCGLPPSECSNRAFISLSHRVKKGGAFDVGVEVVKTDSRGFGVRACREFAPGEIVMEYTGEIISEAECQRRMREIYAGKHCYYIMEFDQGLHIDGTKGSMARFVNHSCEPNCEVRMVKVSGTPRMAIFAGEQGVFTGEELTYDYNFDNFSENKQACYCGAPSCRGHLARRLNAAEQKLRDREERERQLRAEAEAKLIAAEKEREKATKAKRGSGWRGWVTLGEIKEDLKQQKAAQAEAEKNSSRAQRLAARHGGAPVSSGRTQLKQEPRRQRKPRVAATETVNVDTIEQAEEKPSRPTNRRSLSTTSKTGQSKFAEHLPITDELDTFVSRSIAQLEALEQSLQQENDADLSSELPVEEGGKKSKLVRSSTAKASSVGKAVFRTVEKAVVDSLRQGKVKVMRQSTLSFTKVV